MRYAYSIGITICLYTDRINFAGQVREIADDG